MEKDMRHDARRDYFHISQFVPEMLKGQLNLVRGGIGQLVSFQPLMLGTWVRIPMHE